MTRKVAMCLVVLIMAGVYIRTSCVESSTADSGELISSAYVLGIPHPTGYGSYNLCAKSMMMLVPMGNSAERAAWLSALFGILATLLLFQWCWNEFGPVGAGAAAMSFGFAQTPWAQFVNQEVYAMHVFFLMLLFISFQRLLRYKRLRDLCFFMFVSGLALSHHLLTGLFLPAFLVWFAGRGKMVLPTRWWTSIPFVPLGLSTWLYLPLRSGSDCVIRWLPVHHLDSFLFHALGKQFRPIMFQMPFAEMLLNLGRFFERFMDQWTIPVIFLGLIGFCYLGRSKPRVMLFLLIILTTLVVFSINYRIVDIDVYYLQAYLPFCMFAGAGTAGLVCMVRGATGKRWPGVWIVSGCLVLIAFNLVKNYFNNNQQKNFIAFDYAMNVFNSCPQDTVLITQGWSSPFVFSYLEHVMDYRPDIKVVVDYKGTNFQMAFRENWDISVCTTVTIDVPGLEQAAFQSHGMVYLFGSKEYLSGVQIDRGIWTLIRTRSLQVKDIALDYHTMALLAAYFSFVAEDYHAGGDADEAGRNLLIAEAFGVGNNLIANNLSGIYFKMGRLDDAERLARKSIALDDSFPQAHHNLGNVLLKQGRFMQAIQHFQLSNDRLISMGRAHQAMGFAMLRKGDYQSALNELREAGRYNPNSCDIQLNISTALINLGHLEEAAELLEDLQEELPGNPDVMNNLALLLIRQNRLDEADALLKQVLDADPLHFNARTNQAIMDGMRGNLENAIFVFTSLLSESPSDLICLNNLALAYYHLGRMGEAKDLWMQSIKINPEQRHILENLRILGVSEGELKQQIRVMPR